jgi:hypothetical protein
LIEDIGFDSPPDHLCAKFLMSAFFVSDRKNRTVALRTPEIMTCFIQSVVNIKPPAAVTVLRRIVRVLRVCTEHILSDARFQKAISS